MSESSTPPLKICPRCKEEKSCADFSREVGAKDGLQRQCKTCNAAYRAEHREDIAAYKATHRVTHRAEIAAHQAAYQAEHREEKRAYNVVYQAEHREELAAYRVEHREEKHAYSAAYRTAHPEKKHAYYIEHLEEYAAYQTAYRVEHREEIAIHRAAYQSEHPEERAAYQRNRRARKKGNGGTHTAEDIKVQYDRQKGKCYYCKTPVGKKYHVDHVTPLVLEGSNGTENLVVACPSCNRSKGAKHPMEYCGRLL